MGKTVMKPSCLMEDSTDSPTCTFPADFFFVSMCSISICLLVTYISSLERGAADKILSFTMKALPSGGENPVENIRPAADGFVQQATDTVVEHSDQLQDYQLDLLTEMYEKQGGFASCE